jgi:hypothetical protein
MAKNLVSSRGKVGDVQFKLQVRDGEPWTLAGEWFSQLVNFGRSIGDLTSRDIGGLPSKMLLATPGISYVTSAIGLGLSIQRYENQQDVLEPLDVGEVHNLPEGQLIRVEWEKRMVVGRLSKIDSKQHILALRVDNDLERCAIKQAKAVRLAPRGFPEGIYWLTGESGETFKGWIRQGSPAGIVFGDSSFYSRQLETRVSSQEILAALQKDDVSLVDAMRLDQLTPKDLFPHFVNVFERTHNFPEAGTAALETVKSCSICILNGNEAVEKLFSNSSLSSIPTLGIIDLNSTRYQELALNSVKSTVGYLKPLDPMAHRFSNLLPEGSFFWGWSEG